MLFKHGDGYFEYILFKIQILDLPNGKSIDYRIDLHQPLNLENDKYTKVVVIKNCFRESRIMTCSTVIKVCSIEISLKIYSQEVITLYNNLYSDRTLR